LRRWKSEWGGVLDVVATTFYASFGCGVLIEFPEQLACFVLGVAEILLVLKVWVSLFILLCNIVELLHPLQTMY
jgi:hypothetical protein